MHVSQYRAGVLAAQHGGILMTRSRRLSQMAFLAVLTLAGAAADLALTPSQALAVACAPGHNTVIPPCTFDNGALLLTAAAGEVVAGQGGGHHTLVTFPVDSVLGPGIQLAADIAGGFPPYRATDTGGSSVSGTITFGVSTVSGLSLIEDVSVTLLNPLITGTGSITAALGSLTLTCTLSTCTSFGESLFSPTNSFSGLFTFTGSTGSAGNASVDGVRFNFSLVAVPEPGTLFLFASAVVGLAGRAAWKKRYRA